MKTPDWRDWRCSGVFFIFNFEHIFTLFSGVSWWFWTDRWVLRFHPISGQIINKFQFLRPQKFGKMLVTGIWPWAREYETDGFRMVGCCFFAFMKSIFSIFFSSDSYNVFVTYFSVLVARRLDLNLQERLEIIIFIDLFHLSSNNISLALQWWWSILIDAAA